MTQLRPLLSDSSDEFERAVLSSARLDVPKQGARRGTLAALGLASSAGAVAASTTAQATTLTAAGSKVATAATTASAGASAGAVAGSGPLIIAKWIGAGVVAGSLGAGTLTAVNPPAQQPTGTNAAATQTAKPSAHRTAAAVWTPAPGTARPQQAANVELQRGAERAASPAAARRVTDTDVAAELKLLDEARQAMGRGDSSRALTHLAERDRRFAKKGALGQEAKLLRIEALLAAGRLRAATAAAQQFLQRHTASPHRSRVQRLLKRATSATAHRATASQAPAAAPTARAPSVSNTTPPPGRDSNTAPPAATLGVQAPTPAPPSTARFPEAASN